MTNRTALIAAVPATSALAVAGWCLGSPGVASGALGLSFGPLGDLLSALVIGKSLSTERLQRSCLAPWLIPLLFVGKQGLLFALAYLVLRWTGLALLPFLLSYGAYHVARLGYMFLSPSRYVAWMTSFEPQE